MSDAKGNSCRNQWDLLPVLAEQFNRTHGEASSRARVAGGVLRRARRLLGLVQWRVWVELNCNVTQVGAQQYLRLARAGTATPKRPPVEDRLAVICGWCASSRADLGLPPKQLCGPREPDQVRHGICETCSDVLDQKLEELTHAEPSHSDLSQTEQAKLGVPEWSLAAGKLKTVFLHADGALEAIRQLQRFRSHGLADGITDLAEELVVALEALKRLASELVLTSLGRDYDDAAFGTQP